MTTKEEHRAWYLKEVTEKVTELLKLSYETESGSLEFNNDEYGFMPYVKLWVYPNEIKARGYYENDGDDPTWMQPDNGFSWGFLECCEKVLEKYNKIKKEIQ